MLLVTAGVIEKNGKVLIAKRKDGKCLGNNWEFPGGKLDPGETPQECLKRELLEELNIETEIEEFICSSEFTCGEKSIKLLAYRVSYVSGEIKIVDHEEYRWVTPAQFKDYNFVKADVNVVDRLLQIF